mmetsp:Transcript_6162/g.7970  ORF Transcript_6162/g.7970 Transcript_6162/m.7970 type:complete len:164 (+) Transcript_6162:1-492(+)
MNSLFGEPIPPCFDSDPQLQKQENVVKKLTDEEEKALRAIELQESLKKREEAGKEETKSPSDTKEQIDQQKVHKKFENSLEVIPKVAKKSQESKSQSNGGLAFYQGERRTIVNQEPKSAESQQVIESSLRTPLKKAQPPPEIISPPPSSSKTPGKRRSSQYAI